MNLRMSCSKSNSNTCYGFPGMRNQEETKKERSQLTSIQQNSTYYLPRGGPSENNVFKARSGGPWMHIQVETQKKRYGLTSISKIHSFISLEGGV